MKTPDQIIVLAVCYVLLFLLCFWVWKMKSDTLISERVQSGRWMFLHIRHAGGIIIIALLPLLLLPVLPTELFAFPENVSSIQAVSLITAGIVLYFLATKETGHVRNQTPVINKYSSFHAVLHIIFRSAFLISYEWFFRGCILLSCVTLFGLIQAIIINLVLYSFIHSFNGKKEVLGSIPLGLLFCVFTIWLNSVWPVILLHLLLSFSYESKLLYFFFQPLKN